MKADPRVEPASQALAVKMGCRTTDWRLFRTEVVVVLKAADAVALAKSSSAPPTTKGK